MSDLVEPYLPKAEYEACREAFEALPEYASRLLFKRGGGAFNEDIPASDYCDSSVQRHWIIFRRLWKHARAEVRSLWAENAALNAKVTQMEMDATANECSLNTLRKLLDGPPCLPLDQETPESALLEWTDCIHRALVFLGPRDAIKEGK